MSEKDEEHELSAYSHRIRFPLKVSSLWYFPTIKGGLFLVSLRLCPLNRHDEVGCNESIIWNFGSQTEHNHPINNSFWAVSVFKGGGSVRILSGG